METFNIFINLINSAPAINVLAALAFLVSALSAYNSSRAIRLSQRTEKRLVESEANMKKLKTMEKQTRITSLLNEALMDLSQANILLKLCRLSLPNLLCLYSSNISNSSRLEYHTELKNTDNAIKNIEAKISKIESNIRKAHEDSGQKADLPEVEKHLSYSDVLRKAAKMEFQKSQHIYQDLMGGIEIVIKATLKKNSFEI